MRQGQQCVLGRVSQGAALLSIALASPMARGQEPETVCEDARVRIQGRPDERWLEPIVRACEDLRTMPDSDGTARVRIVPAGHDLIVDVLLKDGRSTLRRVEQPGSLKSTLEALLTIPPSPRTPPPPVPTPPPVATPSLVNEVPNERPPAPPPATISVGVELGGSVGGRIAGGQGYLSFAPGGFAQIRVGDWLFGMGARWDVIQLKRDVGVNNFEMETIGAGISVARRFRPSFGDIDLGISPRLLAETQSYLTSAVDERADTKTDVRFGAFTRAAFGRAPLRLFVEADGELSPGRIRRDIRVDPALPPLPSWSAGLSVGAVWGHQ